MDKFEKSKLVLQIVMASLVATFAVAGIVAATTIGTNITSNGTLTIYGATSVGGALTATSTLAVTGAATLSDDLIIDTNLLFVDDSANKIGIGTSSDLTVLLAVGSSTPSTVSGYRDTFLAGALEVDGAIQFDGALTVVGLTTLDHASTSVLTISGASYFATASSTGLATLDSASFGNGTTIANFLFGTCVVDLPSTIASSTGVADCTATGVTTSHRVFVNPISTSTSMIFRSASSTAANTIQVSAYNTGYAQGAGSGTVDPDASTWEWMAIR